MTTFHHGGRIGDCVYALYTVKALGGGDVFLTSFHTPGWDEQMAKRLLPFIEYQQYVTSAIYLPIKFGDLEGWRHGGGVPKELDPIAYNLWEAEKDYNPEAFPEWHGGSWPGNCHIAKRYAVHFDVPWDPDSIWLNAPATKKIDIVFHMPMRRMVRPSADWAFILNTLQGFGHSVLILGGMDDIGEWLSVDPKLPRLCPDNFLVAADYINSAKLFLGGASSCNTVAEGLKKPRIVELADDCDDTYPYGTTGQCANAMSIEEVVNASLEILNA